MSLTLASSVDVHVAPLGDHVASTVALASVLALAADEPPHPGLVERFAARAPSTSLVAVQHAHPVAYLLGAVEDDHGFCLAIDAEPAVRRRGLLRPLVRAFVQRVAPVSRFEFALRPDDVDSRAALAALGGKERDVRHDFEGLGVRRIIVELEVSPRAERSSPAAAIDEPTPTLRIA